jgi:poly(A) polymerase
MIFAKEIVRRLAEHGHVAFFAGGCVRDFVMGIEPTDYDVATSATPTEVQRIFGARHTLPIGVAFGVVCVHQKISGIQHRVEVATFRRDESYSDGRHPDQVVFSSPDEDASRRDFSINGLFYDPITNEVIDFVGGLDDVEGKTVRAIGDPIARLSEDRLRMLRAARFAARFDFAIDRQTISAIQKLAGRIHDISPERISAELHKMFAHASRVLGIELLDELLLLNEIFPELANIVRDAAAKDKFERVLLQGTDFGFEETVALVGLIQADHKKFSHVCQQRWRLSNIEADGIAFSIANVPWLLESDSLPWSKLQPILISPYVDTAMKVARAWLMAHERSAAKLERCRQSLALPPDQLNPKPLVDGQMLMALGLPTGPLYARLINSARVAQLDGVIENGDAARRWLESEIERLSPK